MLENMRPGHVLTAAAWLVIALAAVCIVMAAIRRSREQKAAPRESARAAVVSTERHIQHYHSSHRYDSLHFATFRLEDGRELTFRIPEAEFERIQEGDQGELTWQGTRFLFFGRR